MEEDIYNIYTWKKPDIYHRAQELCEKWRWTSWAPVLNKPTVSVDAKQHFNVRFVSLGVATDVAGLWFVYRRVRAL